MTNTILAWHGDPALRQAAVERMRAHALADALIQHNYVTLDPAAPGGYRGCFYGCLVAEIEPDVFVDLVDEDGHIFCEEDAAPRDPHDGWSGAAARLLGLPVVFGKAAEHLFEALPRHAAPEFAVRLTEAIRPGVDLHRVIDRWMLALLVDPTGGIRRAVRYGDRWMVDRVAGLLQERIDGHNPDAAEWDTARETIRKARANREDEPSIVGEYGEWQEWYRRHNAASPAQCASVARPTESTAVATSSAAADILDEAANPINTIRWQADLLVRLTADAAPAEVTG